LALRGVGPESEAESVRFHGRRVTKVGPEVKHGYFWNWRCDASRAAVAARVKRERLDFLADNPLYTKRFAYFVGRRCRQATIKDVAKELALD
jgi:hypothetical protein